MKNVMVILLCLTFFLMYCQMSNSQGYEMSNSQKYEIPKSGQAVNGLLCRIEHSLEKKYKMKTIGTNVAMPGGVVKLLGLDFHIRGPLSREEIRKILIESAQDFLTMVNSDEAVRSYLENYPFKIENVHITLFCIDSRGFKLDDPYIGIAGIARGELDYKILITTDIPSIKSEFEESYEEAMEALQNQ
jgi:hypothetical protein